MSLYEIGESNYIEGNYTEALKYFKESYENEEEKIDALNYIGCCYMNLGEYDKAIKTFDKILSYTLWERALFNKGRVYLKLERYDEALAYFNRAMMVNPDNDEVYYYLGVYYDKVKDFQVAIANYEKAIKHNEKESEYHLNLGVACYRIKEYEKAINELDICIALDDIYTKINALFNKGVILHSQESYEAALSVFMEAEALSPNDIEIKNMIANSFDKLKEYGKCLLWINKILNINQNDKEALKHKEILLKNIKTDNIINLLK